MIRKIKLYFNTIKYLKTKQVFYQLKKKVRTYKYKTLTCFPINNYMPLKLGIKDLDLDDDYLRRFDTNKILENQILLLNEEYMLDIKSWNNTKASHLWNFNLHYFEFAIALAAAYTKKKDIKYYNKFKELLLNWIENNSDIKGDAWQAYTISLRIPNLLICFDLFGKIFKDDKGFREQILKKVYHQYKYLMQHQEQHLLGNHYFENIKTILICSLYFKEDSIYKTYFLKLQKQIKEQILEDGMHFELSLMYHKIVLEDIIRIAFCLQQRKPEDVKSLIPTIQKMADILASLEKDMGKIPLFNDAGDGVAKETYQLLNATKHLFGIEPIYKNNFPESGYYKYYKKNIAIMFDAGRLGPDYMPGHGHCDALSFELSLSGKPVFVNSGTYQYQGELRKYFRSTEAHNTIKIGNQQQSECWGEHRVARRISNVTFQENDNVIFGAYENHLGNIHQRSLVFIDTKKLIIRDLVKVKSGRITHSYLHLAPHLTVEKKKDNTYEVFNRNKQLICTISVFGKEKIIIHKDGILTNYSPTFGVLEKKIAIEFQWNFNQKQSEIHIDFN